VSCGARELGFEARGLLPVGGYLGVDMFPVGVVVGEGGVDAGQRKVLVLADDLLG
jgi:hypothetical protein